MRIAIFTDELETQGGWHGAQLEKAFASRGVEAVFVSLRDCVIDLSQHSPCIHIPHFDELPKIAFVRGIAGGTLQQITTRLNVMHILKMQNVLIYNDAKAIERTVDKSMTSFLLHQSGIKTPRTWVCESRQAAHAVIKQQQALVIKPIFGSQGQGVRLVSESLPLPMDKHVDGVFYLQSFVKSTHDYRVFVVNNKAIAAMRRSGEGWLHNVALGAKCEAIHCDDILELAVQASKMLGISYCGVDVIRDEKGELYVLEVNSIPAWRGLQNVSQINIAQVLVDDCLSLL